ncbi:MAG TPA: P1 family peptidase [Bryobacteraceae bacterium]|nr:P1 family peptidase [Bryobacteraceae bacterium]
MKGLTDVPGIRVGHATNLEAVTGCTAVLSPGGAVAGLDARGSATGSEEWDLLNPLHLTSRIHAVVLSGGSAFGLETCSGVRRWLASQGIGFETRYGRVPLVLGAILYDLGVAKAGHRPDREMGEAAAKVATDGPVVEGSVGAGSGATTGKVFGLQQAMKGGIGSFSASVGPAVKVGALAAVNCFGDVVDPRTGHIVAGARTAPDSRDFVRTTEAMRRGARGGLLGENTTLVVVATNAGLGKPEATKLAQMAQHGMVRAISPVHTLFDGDVVFALSTGGEKADLNELGVVAAEVVAQAIVRAVKAARTLGGVPGLAG